MNFRMIWMGSDDDSDDRFLVPSGKGPRDVSKLLRYGIKGQEMVRQERLKNGSWKSTPLANFVARIVRDILIDDGGQLRREFSIEADIVGRKVEFQLPVSEFARMDWVLKRLGPQALVYPGRQQHARAAIQSLSGHVAQERIYSHLGWTKHGQDWVYLHAGGAVGPDGFRDDLGVQLPDALKHYRLQKPTESEGVIEGIRSSLEFLSLAPDRITIPLLAAVYRTPLGDMDFSIFLTGRTGTFKTSLTSLCQQHFGPEMNATNLPANFASTANALEALAYQAKDAVMVVDDFVPSGRTGENAVQDLAEWLFRAAGNHHGRNRLGGNGRLRVSLPPRALLIATGEDIPCGHSLRSRMLIIEVGPADVNRSQLSICQVAAVRGQLAAAMAAYLSWVAPCYEQLKQRLQTRVDELTCEHQGHAPIHARLPKLLAELRAGWETWIDFANAAGALDENARTRLQERAKRAFKEQAVRQAPYHHESDPAHRFLVLLRAAIASGTAHIANRNGKAPDNPEMWGWRKASDGLTPQGVRIGWLARDDLFLEPAASYRIAQQLAGPSAVSVSEHTLRRRLNEAGVLASVDPGRKMLLVRRTLDGAPRLVLHLEAQSLNAVTPR